MTKSNGLSAQIRQLDHPQLEHGDESINSNTVRMLGLVLWAAFLFSPLLWPKITDNLFATHLLALAMGLLAAAWMGSNARGAGRTSSFSWLLLLLLLLPITLQLAGGELRNPWRAFEMALYVSAAWLVFQMCREGAERMFGSLEWSVLLAFAGNVCVLFALLQQFHLPLFHGSEVFPLWQPFPVNFAGMQIQANLEALFLILICMHVWGRAMAEQRAWPWWLASVMPCAGIFATSSRGGALVLLLGAGVLLWMSRKRGPNALSLGGILLLGLAISQYWHMYPELIGQVPTLADRMASVGIIARLFIWDMCLHLFLSHPWLGIGAGNLVSYGTQASIPVLAIHPEFAAKSSALAGGHASAHDLLLQFLTEWGICGGVFVVLLLAAVALRTWRVLRQYPGKTSHAQVQAGIGASLMLVHGMFSVSMGLEYFMVLFALYAAALFPVRSDERPASGQRAPLNKAVFFFPALFVLFNWYSFVHREWQAEASANLPLNSAEFTRKVGAAIDNPWSSRAALAWYFHHLLVEHAPAAYIVGSESLAYRYWMQHQCAASLSVLILIAHLKDDGYAEQRRVKMLLAAYPEYKGAAGLKEHIRSGHQRGEAIEISF